MSRALVVFAVVAGLAAAALEYKYHTNVELENVLKELRKHHPDLIHLYSIGTSIEGRELWVAKVTAVREPAIGVPNVKLIGNIHGNEALGREILLYFLEYLVDEFKSDQEVQWLLENTIIHILPSLNPDGFQRASEGLCTYGLGRENVNGSDLNRSFPDYFQNNRDAIQKETRAVMNWMDKIPFVLSASLHGGALVANYPFENLAKPGSVPMKQEHKSPDDDVFRHLALVYSKNHETMHLGIPCEGDDTKFDQGIVNGAAWYILKGGMQDYNYAFKGCMEITLELSCCKYPMSDELESYWKANRQSLFSYVREVHRGVTGQVLDKTNKTIENATCHIIGRNMPFHTSKTGEFWRILLPGKYTIQIKADGYKTLEQEFVVSKSKEPSGLTKLKLKISPLGEDSSEDLEEIGATEIKPRITPANVIPAGNSSGEPIPANTTSDGNTTMRPTLANATTVANTTDRPTTTTVVGTVSIEEKKDILMEAVISSARRNVYSLVIVGALCVFL